MLADARLSLSLLSGPEEHRQGSSLGDCLLVLEAVGGSFRSGKVLDSAVHLIT